MSSLKFKRVVKAVLLASLAVPGVAAAKNTTSTATDSRGSKSGNGNAGSSGSAGNSNGNSGNNGNSGSANGGNSSSASGSTSSSATASNSGGNGNPGSNGNSSSASSSSSSSSSSTSSAGNSSTGVTSNGSGNGNSGSNGNSSSASGNSSGSSSSAGNGTSTSTSTSTSNGNGNGNGNGSSGSAESTGGSSSGSGSATPGGTFVWVGATSDVTYAYDTLLNAVAATDYYGLVSGNDSKGINDLGLSWGDGWTLVAKDNVGSSDDVRGTWQNIAFSLDAGAGGSSGFWLLTGSGGSLASGPMHLDMVAVVKSSTNYALYYFEDVLFDGSAMGSWLSPSFNANGLPQDLSHLSAYLRLGDPYGLPDNGPSSSDGGLAGAAGGGMGLPSDGGLASGAGGAVGPAPSAVPEPGSLALVGVALAGLATARRRRSA